MDDGYVPHKSPSRLQLKYICIASRTILLSSIEKLFLKISLFTTAILSYCSTLLAVFSHSHTLFSLSDYSRHDSPLYRLYSCMKSCRVGVYRKNGKTSKKNHGNCMANV